VVWSVGKYSIEGKPCLLLQTDGFLHQEIETQHRRTLNVKNTANRAYWVDETTGKILKETSFISTQSGNYSMEAIYGEEEYELTMKTPKGETKGAVTPGMGMDKLQALFSPMIVEGKVVLKEKEFARLDPLTGGPIKFTARIAGKFSGRLDDSKRIYEGHTIDIKGGGRSEKAFVSHSGLLMKVELPQERYLHLEMSPEQRKLFGGQ
jgi:hypothetical protein